jgi:spore maturation protein CgeB
MTALMPTKANLKSGIAGRAPVMVFSGDFWRGSSEYSLAQGFRKLGWGVQQVEIMRHFAELGESAPARATNRLLAPFAVKTFRSKIYEAVRTLKPDVFLSIKGVYISSKMLQDFKRLGVVSVLFYPDVCFDHPGTSLNDFEFYDLVVTTKSFQLEMLRERFGSNKIAYVPHGYGDGVHIPLLDPGLDNYAFDLQHIGGHTGYKQRWIEALQALCPDANLRVAGPRWDTQAASSLRDCTISSPLYDCSYSLALQAARINIAVMMGPDGDAGWQDLVSTRTFEIPACRSFMLHIDNEEIREFFKVGKEIDVFSSPEELADKARFYLGKPELRQRMIERAYERCVPAYGYEARAAQINQILVNQLAVAP